MSNEDRYSGLPWMTEEMKNHLIQRDKIVKEQNIDALFALQDNNSQILMAKIDREFSSYPDGMLRDLYRKYAENNRREVY